MAIIEIQGFKFLDGLNSGTIVIESNRINEYCEYINHNRLCKIYFADGYYNHNNIDILRTCPTVEHVNLNSFYIDDCSALYSLGNLKSLYSNDVRGSIDLSLLKNLEELAIDLTSKVSGISKCYNLKELSIWKYKPKSGNLEEISNLKKIEYLAITKSAITSLRGCSELRNLKKLELNYLSKLEYIDELEFNANTLKHLRFESCKKIRNHEYIIKLKELELLAFSDCNEIPNIGFIRDLPKLRSFTFVNTNIVDGDLSPCIGLDYVGFLNKKHYSHKSEDFKKK